MDFFVPGDATVKKKPAPKTPPKAGNWPQHYLGAKKSSAMGFCLYLDRLTPGYVIPGETPLQPHPHPQFHLCIFQAVCSSRASAQLGSWSHSTALSFLLLLMLKASHRTSNSAACRFFEFCPAIHPLLCPCAHDPFGAIFMPGSVCPCSMEPLSVFHWMTLEDLNQACQPG